MAVLAMLQIESAQRRQMLEEQDRAYKQSQEDDRRKVNINLLMSVRLIIVPQ